MRGCLDVSTWYASLDAVDYVLVMLCNAPSAGLIGVGKILAGCSSVCESGSVPADSDDVTVVCIGVSAVSTPEAEGEVGPWDCELVTSVEAVVWED